MKGKPCNQLWNAAVWGKEGNFKLKRKVAKIVQTLLLICVCVCIYFYIFSVLYMLEQFESKLQISCPFSPKYFNVYFLETKIFS